MVNIKELNDHIGKLGLKAYVETIIGFGGEGGIAGVVNDMDVVRFRWEDESTDSLHHAKDIRDYVKKFDVDYIAGSFPMPPQKTERWFREDFPDEVCYLLEHAIRFRDDAAVQLEKAEQNFDECKFDWHSRQSVDLKKFKSVGMLRHHGKNYVVGENGGIIEVVGGCVQLDFRTGDNHRDATRINGEIEELVKGSAK